MNNEINQILNYIYKQSSKDNLVSISKLRTKFNYEHDIIDDCLDYLLKNKLIKITYKTIRTNSVRERFYTTTILGNKYFKRKFKNKLLKFIKIIILDFLIPLIVAYITSAMTCNQCGNNSTQTINNTSENNH